MVAAKLLILFDCGLLDTLEGESTPQRGCISSKVAQRLDETEEGRKTRAKKTLTVEERELRNLLRSIQLVGRRCRSQR